jgi:tRNA(Ile)-lysidine synthetase-like protein
MLIDRVRAYCIQYGLFNPGPVVVAVSGGADSLALLHLLLALRDEFQSVLHVATFDHQLRGAASAADTHFVYELARSLHLPCTIGSVDVAANARKWSLGIEAAARKARYAFFAEVAAVVGAHTIAVGHHQDDQAETVLMHVLRGTGLAGLRGILPKTKHENGLILVRPLLDVSRADLDSYIHELGITPRVDETNADPAYLRNRLRHEIIPLLETINPQVRSALARTAEIARQDYEVLQRSLPPIPDPPSIARQDFLTLAHSQQALWIRNAAHTLSPDLDLGFERTGAAIDLIRERTHGVTLPLGDRIWLRVDNATVLIFNEATDRYPENCPQMPPASILSVEKPSSVDLPGTNWQLSAELSKTQKPDPVDAYTVQLTIPDQAQIVVRTRRPGDRFKPHGMNGQSQKLSDTLINLKVPAEFRDRIPLLIIGGEIAWFIAPTPTGLRSRMAHGFSVESNSNDKVWCFTFRSIEP